MADDITQFSVSATDDELADLRRRLRQTRWPGRETVSDWSQGIPLTVVQSLCEYWADGYDWRSREAIINSYPQFRTTIDGLGIHFVHARSPEPDALPLVLTHGWPGSVVEFLEVIGPLTDPRAHGGDPADAFHVVCPSLPGYGWSDKPSEVGWTVQRIAQAWATLMARLGYSRYGAQGGDWGAFVTGWLANEDAEHLAGIHLNLVMAGPPPEMSEPDEREAAALAGMLEHRRTGTGYSKQQSTRPQTLGYALADSPAGQCAWIIEKFWAWTDLGDHPDDPVGAFGADRLLDNVMAYWLPGTAASSARLYWESFRSGQAPPVEVAMGGTVFPREIVRPTREWAGARYRDIRYWSEPEHGGHFAAFEQPEIFVEEVRTFFRLVR